MVLGVSSNSHALQLLAHASTGFDYTRLPSQIPGVDSNGWYDPKAPTNDTHVQSITVSTDLGREELFELGTRQPYARVVTFPIEVTCDIEVLSISGDMINAFADGCNISDDPCTGIQDNLVAETIRLATCEGTRIYLGSNNKLASVNYGGGDAGGGNAGAHRDSEVPYRWGRAPRRNAAGVLRAERRAAPGQRPRPVAQGGNAGAAQGDAGGAGSRGRTDAGADHGRLREVGGDGAAQRQAAGLGSDEDPIDDLRAFRWTRVGGAGGTRTAGGSQGPAHGDRGALTASYVDRVVAHASCFWAAYQRRRAEKEG